MKLINKLALLVLLASPLANAEVDKQIKSIPALVGDICSNHPNQAACYGYVISVIKMTTVAGSIDGMCQMAEGLGTPENTKNCTDANNNVEFIHGMSNEK